MKRIFISLFVLFLSIHSFAGKLIPEELFCEKETSKAHYHFSLQRNHSRLPNRKCLICHKESCSEKHQRSIPIFSLQRERSRLPNRKCLICHKESCSEWKCCARKAIHIFIADKLPFDKVIKKVQFPWRKIATALIALGGGAFLAKKSRKSNTSCNLSVVNDTKEEKKE